MSSTVKKTTLHIKTVTVIIYSVQNIQVECGLQWHDEETCSLQYYIFK